MSTSDDDGPVFKWTFPLLRTFSGRDRPLLGMLNSGDFGSNVSKATDTVKDGVENTVNEVNKLTNRDNDSDEDDKQDELSAEIEELKNNNLNFSQGDGDTGTTISISEDAFLPTTLEVGPGDTVVWENDDEVAHRIISFSGDEFSTPRLESGDTYERTFDEEGIVEFTDPNIGRGNMCGAVIVGNPDDEPVLPCSGEQNLEFFEEEELDGLDNDGSVAPSMSDAAEEKDNMERGF